MNKALSILREVNGNDTETTKEAISVFFGDLTNHSDNEGYRLVSLGKVINRFPRFCAPHRSTAEKYLANYLDGTNIKLVIEAAKCACYLQQVRPSQDKAATAKACWREQMLLLCNAAHVLTEALFASSMNMQKKSSNPQKLEIQVLANTPLTTALLNITKVNKSASDTSQGNKYAIALRMRNVLTFIQAMLVEVYPVAKPIRPQAVLEVILHIFSMMDGTNKQDIDGQTGLRIHAFRTLDALIVCLGPNLIPFSALVFKFAMQSLRSNTGNTEATKKTRWAAYNSLSIWLRLLHVHKPSNEGRGKMWEDELTELIMADITPPKQVIELNVNAAIPTKNLSKKAKRQLANSLLRESSIAAHMPSEKNKSPVSETPNPEVVLAALNCAQSFLSTCGIFLKPTTHKMFQETLVRECFMIDSYHDEVAISLLRTLDTARKCVPPNIPPPTQYCLQLYSQLLNHRQTEIARFCSQALLEIRLHLHCSPPTLTYAMDVPQEEVNKGEEKRKTISKRNREVLESLLGVERVPSENIETEIITIFDEPINKKLRTDDLSDTEKISISSGSVKSVELNENTESTDAAQVIKNIPTEIVDNDQDVDVIETVVEQRSEADIVSQDVIDTGEATLQSNEQITDDAQRMIEQEEQELTQNIQSIADQTPESAQSNAEEESIEVFSTQITNLREDNSQLPLKDKVDATKEKDNESSVTVKNNKCNIQTINLDVGDCVPDTNDSDDSGLISGKLAQSTQDTSKSNEEVPQNNEQNLEKENNEALKENGIQSLPEKVHENGKINVQATIVSSKTAETTDSLTVEDMLADFVDEVNEENKTEV